MRHSLLSARSQKSSHNKVHPQASKQTYKQRKFRLCRKWSDWAISSQIQMRFGIFLVLYCAAFLSCTMAVMVLFYEPSIYREFQIATEPVYNYRTANLTSSISTRIEGFESNLQRNTLKLATVAKDVFGNEAPYKGKEA